ncbi:MAG TPA: hypothetical protein VHH73_14895, partial [Verrucomicrobiae bacterium]|nr:hypothetical protein [Verrucomicrobiae bacterium]
MARHIPWLVGLVLAPLLFGSVNPEGQAVVGLCAGLSLLLLIGDGAPVSRADMIGGGLLVLVLVVGIIPLPASVVAALSPERVAFAAKFPVEAGVPQKWLTLSLSPSGSMQRLWELSLVLAFFFLARRAAAERRFAKFFSLVVAVGVLLLAASDAWYRLTGRRNVLGL